MDWYLQALRKFAVFAGRARRKEYWLFILFNILASIALAVADALLGTIDLDTGVGLLSSTYSLAVLIPTIAVAIRRLHDTDRSGWWLLVSLIPVLGTIALLVFLVQDGTAGPNRFGPDPKAGPAS